MSKFIQPVSMRVTQEQYERDLREPLLAMGYEERDMGLLLVYPFIVTNYENKDGFVSNVVEPDVRRNNRHFIPEYNPEYFLAVAAMTNEELGIVGEWWEFKNYTYSAFTNSKLYKCVAKDFNDNMPLFEDNRGEFNGYEEGSHFRNFTKATLQELVAEFTISKPNPTTDTISIPSDSIELLNNLLDMPKDTLNNELINAVQGLLSLAHSYYNDEDITRGNECMNSISRLINNLDLE